MPELDKNLFAGDADLDSDEARGAEVRNLGTDINTKLSIEALRQSGASA